VISIARLHLSLISTIVEPLKGVSLNERHPALSANIRLRRKGMTVANTLVYHNTATNMAIKKFYSIGSWSGASPVLLANIREG
jgi:hypothetical protein